ncbi:Ulp1 family isopeptidase [Candidatus Rhabdochlamydia porcellionis]|jgi:Ulp1 family protease|uniref:Ubiquitin-like protease family profile domain-containing protein n=1 Tax=Candidatus Rhabdochlamydia porcellionis TaxID=225148 RepID=A0ABX8YZD2_9BACT|nr:Ulp1 family isopeptidase [Candidatus Rhabdochlamydia porcellionis]QZA58731.1 hypothetical protein RHAB15C_0000610 [Candidatus Rhabdochlamydia porcellionis]
MRINPINSKQSFIFKPLRIIQSLGWVAVAILSLPTVIGAYFAWKKLAAIWNKHERFDTQKTNEVVSKLFLEGSENGFEEVFSEVAETASKESTLYEQAIHQFKGSSCLGSRSAEAYLDYLKNTEKNLGFHFNTNLLHNLGFTLNEFLTNIKAEAKDAKLIFVPFLLAGNLLREQHIVVAVINKTNEQIEYFDPKGNQFYSIFGRLVDRNLEQWSIPTQAFLEKLSTSIFPDKEPSIIRNINGPQSLSNKVDCGVHALDFIQARMHIDFIPSKYPNYFETSLSSNGKQLRNTMAATLQSRLDSGQIVS